MKRGIITIGIVATTTFVSMFFLYHTRVVYGDGPMAPVITAFSLSGDAFVSDIHTPLENDTTNLVATLDYLDNDSCLDVMSTGTFRIALAHASTSTCASTNYANCYEETSYSGTFSCTDDCSGTEDLDGQIVCTFPLEHYVSPGTWVVTATVADGVFADVVTTTEFTVATTTALELVDTVLDFGVLDLGVTSTEVSTRIRNYGNDPGMEVGVYAQDINCDSGAIDPGNLAVASTSIASWELYPVKTTGLMQALNMSLPVQTVSTTESEENLYWRLKIPDVGIGGYCNGILTVVGIAS